MEAIGYRFAFRAEAIIILLTKRKTGGLLFNSRVDKGASNQQGNENGEELHW